MKNPFNHWDKIGSYPLDMVVDYILTGKNVSNFEPDFWIYHFIGNKQINHKILDFGCGIGRNTFGMGLHFATWSIVGYDCQNMIIRTEDYKRIKYKDVEFSNVKFSSDWEILRHQKFDSIFCCLVLQHIMEKDLKIYINDFKTMTSNLIVSGRRLNDDKDKRSTWSILEENGLIPVKFYFGDDLIPYIPEGDSKEHNTGIYRW